MVPFMEWPLWAQVALILSLVVDYVPIYFAWLCIAQCLRGWRNSTSSGYQAMQGNLPLQENLLKIVD